MSESVSPLLLWLATYLVHSTLLFGLAGLVARRLRSPAVEAQVWRAALVGGLVTATAQIAGLAHDAPMSPMASLLSFDRPPVAAAPPAPAPPAASADPVATGAATPLEEPAREEASLAQVPSGPTPVFPWARLAVLVWAAGASLLLLRLAHLALRARRELRGRAAAEAPLRRDLATLCDRHGLAVPTLTVTGALAGPIALPSGEIVLPGWIPAQLDRRQQRAVLAHELAHQVRRDPQWLVFALLLDALLWIQPLHRLARRRLAALAEIEADAWAARHLPDPRALAESLAACAERLVSPPVALWSSGMVTAARRDCPLLDRIDRLLKGTPMIRPSNLWPARAGALAVLVCGIFLLPGCGRPGFGLFGAGSSTSVTIDDDGDTRMTMRRPGYSMRMEYDGAVTFAEDESDLATLAAACTFSLTERLAGVERGYRVRSDASGSLTRTFFRDGDEIAADADARTWLAQALPRMFRESGLDAEARVARLLARGGPELVLAEVDLAASDHAKATYLGQLLAVARLDEKQFETALASAAKFGSDFELRTALERALATQQIDGVRLCRLLEVARQLDSDFELRTVLEKVAPRGGEPAVATAYLTAARQLDSDFERRTALVALLEGARIDNGGLKIALDLTSELGSDFEKRTVLEVLAKSVASDPELHRRYREVARDMSEFERGQALRALDDATAL